MKKNLTEIVFILDRSGSMQGLEKDTIGGYNSILEKQRKEPGEAIISTVLFDDMTEVLHDRVALDKIKNINEEDYYVRGCTALLDAVGGAIHHISNVHKYVRDEDRPERTLFVITTDGMENASRRYSYNDVRRMIEQQKEKYGWEFIFLGANIDSEEMGEKIGIGREYTMNYESTTDGTRENYERMNCAISMVRNCMSTPLSAAWKDNKGKGIGKKRR